LQKAAGFLGIFCLSKKPAALSAFLLLIELQDKAGSIPFDTFPSRVEIYIVPFCYGRLPSKDFKHISKTGMKIKSSFGTRCKEF
jgi:hypothetical protein